MTALFIVRNLIFIVFFSLIGTRYLSFIPIFIGLLAFMYSSDQEVKQQVSKEQVKHFFVRHAFAFARVCMMLGGRGIANIMGSTTRYVSMWLIAINIFLWIFAYVVEYEDGKEMFHMGYWVSSFIFMGSLLTYIQDFGFFAEVVMSRVALSMALYAFIVFIGKAVGKKVSHTMSYPLFILFTISMMFLIYRWTKDDIELSLVLSQVMLMAMYCIIRGVYRYEEDQQNKPLEENTEELRRILAGKHTVKKKMSLPFQDDVVHDIYAFLERLDDTTKFVISFFNVLLILGQVYLFVVNMGTGDLVIHEILLWFGIIAFFVNYLLLRQIGFYHSMQRIIAFLLLNFGIYLSIINIFGTDPVYLVGVGTIWSIVNSLVMFHTGWLERRGILESRDYSYWIGSNLLVTACNLYFIFLIPLSLQLRFFVALMYFGVQLFLTLYNIRHTGKPAVYASS